MPCVRCSKPTLKNKPCQKCRLPGKSYCSVHQPVKKKMSQKKTPATKRTSQQKKVIKHATVVSSKKVSTHKKKPSQHMYDFEQTQQTKQRQQREQNRAEQASRLQKQQRDEKLRVKQEKEQQKRRLHPQHDFQKKQEEENKHNKQEDVGHIPTSENSIYIDGIHFYIIGCCKSDRGGREYVHIESRHGMEKRQFFFYRSQSETGMWRYCLKVSWLNMYWKGDNYITSTFVHMKLQSFIDNRVAANNNAIHRLTEEDVKDACLPSSFEHFEKLQTMFNKSHFYDTKQEPALKIIGYCNPGTCFVGEHSIEEFLQKLDTNESANPLKSSFNSTYTSVYEEEKKRIFPVVKNHDAQIIAIYAAISAIMKQNFILSSSSPTYLSSRIFDHGFRVIHNFYSVNIKSKLTSKEFTLIYSHYQLTIPHSSLFNGSHFILINLLPVPNYITKYGVNETVIDAGPYIYKMWEYAEQCPIGIKDRNIQSKAGNCYTYIGDFQENVWPLDEVRTMVHLK